MKKPPNGGFFMCAHDAPTPRSSPDMLDKQFDRLVEIADNATNEKLLGKLEND